MKRPSSANDPERATAEVEETPRSLRLRVLGSLVVVVFEAGVTTELACKLQQVWSRCLDTRPEYHTAESHEMQSMGMTGGQRQYSARVVTAIGTSNIAADTFEHFASQLTSVVTICGIEACAGELMMLHASGLADLTTGRTVALVGRSGMGKTTATRILGAELGYVSDETVAVDRAGYLVPYAKPLSVIVDESPEHKRQLGPDELGLRVPPPAATLAAVVLLDRDPAAAEVKISPLGHADAMIELIPQTSSLARIHRPLQWLCSILDACGGAVRITYREADELRWLLPRVLERSAVSARWSPAADDVSGPPDEGGLPPGLLRRAVVVDAVEIPRDGHEGTELIAMVGSNVVRLGGIAPAIWRAVRTPVGLGGIAERIASEVSLPEGYELPLAEAVERLEAHGVLSRTSA